MARAGKQIGSVYATRTSPCPICPKWGPCLRRAVTDPTPSLKNVESPWTHRALTVDLPHRGSVLAWRMVIVSDDRRGLAINEKIVELAAANVVLMDVRCVIGFHVFEYNLKKTHRLSIFCIFAIRSLKR